MARLDLANSSWRSGRGGLCYHPVDKGEAVAVGLVAPATPATAALVPDWVVPLAFFLNAAICLALSIYLATGR